MPRYTRPRIDEPRFKSNNKDLKEFFMPKFAYFLIVMSFPLAASASFGTLTSSDTSGSNKYCKYSNGVVITIKNYEVCPTTVR